MIFARFTNFAFSLSTRGKIIWTAVGAIGTLVCNILFRPYNAIMAETNYGILDFEFTFNTQAMDTILTDWNGILPDVITFMIIDMFYPIFYALLFSGLILLTGDEPTRLRVIGFFGGLIAADCDYIENIFSFVVLTNPDNYWPLAVPILSVFAVVKFALLGVSFIIFLVLVAKKLIG